MFVQPKDEEKRFGLGAVFGPSGAVDVFGASEAFEYERLK